MSCTRILGRKCECGTPIFDQSKSGRCKPCNVRHMNSDPETRRRRGETVKRKCQSDPLYRARKASVVLANKNAGMSDPAKRANMMASWRRNLAKAFTPEAIARKLANQPEGNRKLSERRMAWCPPEYRELYHFLVGPKKLRMAEAKELIAEEISRDLAKLSPFERQDRALANGGTLVANDQKPSLAYPGVYGERKAG